MPNLCAPADQLAGRLHRTVLQHQSSSIPGRDIVQVLTEIPAGVESGWHTRPGEEVGYILAGTTSRAPSLPVSTGAAVRPVWPPHCGHLAALVRSVSTAT